MPAPEPLWNALMPHLSHRNLHADSIASIMPFFYLEKAVREMHWRGLAFQALRFLCLLPYNLT